MLTYKPEVGTDLYPFLHKVPFPQGCIADIKIALKNTNQTPYITAINSAKDFFSIQIQTKNKYIGTFLYAGDLWITVNNNNAFGFILLNITPTNVFSYTGKWYLERCCYTFPVQLQGIKKVFFNGLSLNQQQILNLNFAGDITIRDNSDSKSAIINIGRDANAHEDYTTTNNQPTTFIKSIRGIKADSVIFQSSDSTIEVSPILEKKRSTYVLYINTKSPFPACPQWDSDSKAD